MAKLENGYSRIANEFLEALAKAGLSSSEFSVMLVILRSTYGWQREMHSISASFLAKATGLSVRAVKYARKNLRSKEMIVFGPRSSKTETAMIGPNPDTERWLVNARSLAYRKKLKRDKLQKKATRERTLTGERRHTSSSERPLTQKRNKENNLSNHFKDVWQEYPNKIGKKAALRHFKASCQTREDLQRIKQALDRYKAHLEANPWKHAQHGSTWFNNWTDWVDYEEPISEGEEAEADSIAYRKAEEAREIAERVDDLLRIQEENPEKCRRKLNSLGDTARVRKIKTLFNQRTRVPS